MIAARFLREFSGYMHHNFSNKHPKALVRFRDFAYCAHERTAPISKKIKRVVLNLKVDFSFVFLFLFLFFVFLKKGIYKEN